MNDRLLLFLAHVVDGIQAGLKDILVSKAIQRTEPAAAEPELPDMHTITLQNGTQIATPLEKKIGRTGRVSQFAVIQGRKVPVVLKNGTYQEKTRKIADFSNYEPDGFAIQVLEALNSAGTLSYKDLAKELGAARGKLLGTYRALSMGGYVERDKAGNVWTTAKGISVLTPRSAPKRKRRNRTAA